MNRTERRLRKVALRHKHDLPYSQITPVNLARILGFRCVDDCPVWMIADWMEERGHDDEFEYVVAILAQNLGCDRG